MRRLRLIRRARGLGVPLREIKELVNLAFACSCQTFEQRLIELVDLRLATIEKEREALRAQRQELHQLREALAAPDENAQACKAGECECCRFIDK